jgi:hypothetical protein
MGCTIRTIMNDTPDHGLQLFEEWTSKLAPHRSDAKEVFSKMKSGPSVRKEFEVFLGALRKDNREQFQILHMRRFLPGPFEDIDTNADIETFNESLAPRVTELQKCGFYPLTLEGVAHPSAKDPVARKRKRSTTTTEEEGETEVRRTDRFWVRRTAWYTKEDEETTDWEKTQHLLFDLYHGALSKIHFEEANARFRVKLVHLSELYHITEKATHTFIRSDGTMLEWNPRTLLWEQVEPTLTGHRMRKVLRNLIFTPQELKVIPLATPFRPKDHSVLVFDVSNILVLDDHKKRLEMVRDIGFVESHIERTFHAE